ncbi:MAG: hypothetical protein ACI4O7_15765 [Aristaeellaceae bacterium]
MDHAEHHQDGARQEADQQPEEDIRRVFMDEGYIKHAARAQQQCGYAYQLHEIGIHPVLRRFAAAMRRVFFRLHSRLASPMDLRLPCRPARWSAARGRAALSTAPMEARAVMIAARVAI